jgi:DegV family protein with EDD domain
MSPPQKQRRAEMGKVRVVTDTASSITPELIEKYNVGVARYTIQFGTESFVDDGIDLTVDEFEQKRVTTGQIPKTAIPASGKFTELYRSISEPGDTIYSIHVGSKLSGILGSAQLGAEGVADRDVVVFDTDSVCMVETLMLIEVAEAAAAGATKEELVGLLNELKTRTDFLSTSVELEYIKESGRIGGAEKAADAAIKNIPIIRIQDGRAGVTEQLRTQNAVLRRIIELIKIRAGDKPIKRLAISHSNREEGALKYREIIERELAPEHLYVGQLGITLMTHLGPGALCTSVEYGK